MWTDKSFSRVGWSYENLRAVVSDDSDQFQHRFSVDVWARIILRTVLGAVFLERLVLYLLESVQEMLVDVPFVKQRELFQHDGVLGH